MSKTTNIRTLSEIQHDLDNCRGGGRQRVRLLSEYHGTERHGALLLACSITHAAAKDQLKTCNAGEKARLKVMVNAIEKQFPHLAE